MGSSPKGKFTMYTEPLSDYPCGFDSANENISFAMVANYFFGGIIAWFNSEWRMLVKKEKDKNGQK